MDLTIPTAHTDPYVWLAVFAAHALIGVGAWIAARVLGLKSGEAAAFVSVGYFSCWEVAVQALGAGIADALVDWSAVTIGAVAAWAIYDRKLKVGAVAGLMWSAIALVGVGKRK